MSRRPVMIEGHEAVTQQSGHTAIAAADICLTPVGAALVPIPYPNSAPSAHLKHGSDSVLIGDASVMLSGSELRPSTGNEAGTGGGIVSRITRGPAQALQTSLCVTIEGAHVARTDDVTLHNGHNAVGVLRY